MSQSPAAINPLQTQTAQPLAIERSEEADWLMVNARKSRSGGSCTLDDRITKPEVQGGAPPNSFLVVTFLNKGAAEMTTNLPIHSARCVQPESPANRPNRATRKVPEPAALQAARNALHDRGFPSPCTPVVRPYPHPRRHIEKAAVVDSGQGNSASPTRRTRLMIPSTPTRRPTLSFGRQPRAANPVLRSATTHPPHLCPRLSGPSKKRASICPY